MKTVYATLIAVFLFVFSISALAGGLPWGKPMNEPGRFVVLDSYNNEAVWDKETGLVWERSPGTAVFMWQHTSLHCNNKNVGNRKGWRLPTIQEVASLIDPTVPRDRAPTLPADHPFINVQLSEYWSATQAVPAVTEGSAWAAAFSDGFVGSFPRSAAMFVWCVRSGQGVDLQ